MEIERTALFREIQAITNQPNAKLVHYFWRCEILANGKRVDPLKVLSVDFIRDYIEQYADEVYIELAIGAGTYSHLVYPYKDDITITLFKEPIGQVNNETNVEEETLSFPYRVTVLKTNSMVLEGKVRYGSNVQTGDLMDILYVKFQLTDPLVERLRMESVGGIFPDTSCADLLSFLLTDINQKLQLDEENKIEGVDFFEPTLKEKQKQIVLPHATRFVEAPDFLQSKVGGIYNAGLGFYLQKKHWYVYPLYDLTRFDKSLKTLTLVNVPKNRMPGAEVTYRTTGNQVIALITGATKFRDDSESQILNEGNGVRFLDARKLMDGFSETSKNRTTILRANNNNEFVAEQRKTGLNNVHASPVRITSNNFVELSRLAQRAGAPFQCVWENSNPDLLYPGMPVKYMYVVNGEVKEALGVLIRAHHNIGTYAPGAKSKRYVSNSVLTVFIDRKIDWAETDSEETTA